MYAHAGAAYGRSFGLDINRLFDIVVASLLLIIGLPLIIIFAVLIKLDSKGPVFYTQRRIGLHGKEFMIPKLRSMVVDAETPGKPQWAQKSDPRVTRIGRFIRKHRIDELPQLFSVLKGDMSMVGPRPERPEFVELLSRGVFAYNRRHDVKPGLTGMACVSYDYGSSIEDTLIRLVYDRYYIKHKSIWFDIEILMATVSVVLTGKGAR